MTKAQALKLHILDVLRRYAKDVDNLKVTVEEPVIELKDKKYKTRRFVENKQYRITIEYHDGLDFLGDKE